MWVLTAVVILAVDYLVGRAVGPYFLVFTVLFTLPVMLISWNGGWRCGVLLSVFLCLVRFGFHFLWTEGWPVYIAAINGVGRALMLSLLALLTSALGVQTRKLRERVRTLEGILPICMHCKRIRDEHDQWQPVESYVASRSDAEFSHGLCPACAERYYRDAASEFRKR